MRVGQRRRGTAETGFAGYPPSQNHHHFHSVSGKIVAAVTPLQSPFAVILFVKINNFLIY